MWLKHTGQERTLHTDARRRIDKWLAFQAGNLERFRNLLPYAQIAAETGLSIEVVRDAVVTADLPLYALFVHIFKGKTRPSKPFALYGYDREHCLLDWEGSLAAGLKKFFADHGYYALREVGTEADIAHLRSLGTLFQLREGINLRDLIAHEHTAQPRHLWLIELKGKEAGEFDYYTFAEGLGQIFKYPDELLQGLLGGGMVKAQGHLYRIAQELRKGYWGEMNRSIHLALVVPDFSPTTVWSGGKTVIKADGVYHRPICTLLEYIKTGKSQATSGEFKYQRLFGQILEAIDREYNLRKFYATRGNITFTVLGCQSTLGESRFRVVDIRTGTPSVLRG